MAKIKEIIDNYKFKFFFDEDDNRLNIKVNKGATTEEIHKFESEYGIKIPAELEDLFLLSDGIMLFGIEILPLAETKVFYDRGLLCFHEWGNGDFDCVSFGDEYPLNSVVFLDHSEDRTAFVIRSFREWILVVINEIGRLGTLLHPMDYLYREEKGLYLNVLK
ncbi:SMI1/KNR4 family protein [Sphingobacterium olei]|uniref:SMI1/KNR4 family protein n=1 Tax=Sphingobacterium olei TaxID=2571155 RepID=A0A4U0NHA3_9SPHI|nr:SMI1/KNR4 family protein [Sphingobacterium olei]TJZ53565.1 SMI1/KNR4 family protein [Sphingobacterium olei]